MMISHHSSSLHSSSSKKVKRPSTHVSSQVNPFNSSSLVQTTYGSLSSKQQVENHVLFCARHNQKPIEKVCLHPSCDQEMILCTDCYFDSQNHISNHRDHIFSYSEFIQICREKSLNHQDVLPQDKSFNLIVGDLDSNIIKYKTHIRREEERVDEDFDSLIESVVSDINDLRTKLKEKLRGHADTYQGLCNQLRGETSTSNKESSSNLKNSNEYDSFLINLTSQKNNTCNFKRLITNLKPSILKQLSSELGKNNNLGASNWQSNGAKNDSSSAKESAGYSSVSINPLQINNSLLNTQQAGNSLMSLGEKGVNKFSRNLKDAFAEFQNMTTYKPIYRNQGEANNIYREYIAESRRQYFTFLEGLSKFVALQTNPAAQSNGQFANTGVVVAGANSSNLSNTLGSISSGTMGSVSGSLFGLSSPTSGSKSCMSNSGKKANALRGSLTNFNSLYANLAVPSIDLNNQINNEDLVAFSNASFNPQSVRLADKQQISTFDHLTTVSTNHTKGILAIKVIDQETIVTASSDRSIRFFKSLKEIKEIKFDADVTALGTLGLQGVPQYLLVGLFQSFAVVNLSDYSIVKQVVCAHHESSISQLVGLPDGQTVVTASSDPKIITFNIFNQELAHPKKYFEHRDSIYCLELFPNNKFIASAGKDRSIKVWKLNFFKDFRMNALEKLTLDASIENAHSCDVTALRACASYDNILISGSAIGDIKIWDILLNKPLRHLKNTSGWVFGIITFERPHLAQIGNENRRPIIDSWKENSENCTSPKSNAYTSPKKTTAKMGLLSSTGKSAGKSGEKFSSPVKNTFAPARLGKSHQDQLNNISFLTASFDGAIKVWEALKDQPTLSEKSKNIFECFPFGGLATYRTENTIHLVTSGNKGDTNLNVYAIN